MAARSSPAEKLSGRDIVITRIFNAPRELVWKMWTEPERLKRWWAPKGCTTPSCTVDLRPGGVFHFCMRLPEGRDIWGRGTYREVVAPERLVYVDSFADAKGNAVSPAHYGMSAGYPAETLVTVTFVEHRGKTTVTLRHDVGAASFPERDGMQPGWTEMFDRLGEQLAASKAPGTKKVGKVTMTLVGDREIVMTREFNAPRRLVFEAYTKPEHIARWWGPRRYSTIVDKMDVRPGGVWRFINRDADGNEFAFNGVYREVAPPARIVQTFEFESMPGHISIETATFEEHKGRTTVTSRAVFQSAEDRDAMTQTDMAEGYAESMDRLEEVLAMLINEQRHARKT